MKFNHKGVTLVELLIVIVVLGVIASISLVAVGRVVQNTRINVDHENAERLNQSTRLYRLSNPNQTAFEEGVLSSEALMVLLNEEGFIDDIVEPQARDGSFSWDFDNQVWLYNAQFILSGDDIAAFDPGFFGGNAIQGPYAGTQKNIVIPDVIDGNDILEIYQNAFRYGEEYSETQLTSVAFTQNSQLEHIHRHAFAYNDIQSITFPNSINRIDGRAFIGNDNLSSITIGAGVALEENVFRGGDRFKDAYAIGGAGTYTWDGNTWVKD